MDSGAKKILESVTVKTLHAHNFARSSTQANQVLTDLLARYLTLFASTCAKYAEHAGRLRLTINDAAHAMDELGTSVEELSEYCATEGREMARYTMQSAKRLEDLSELKAQLAIGLGGDLDDRVPLHWGPVPDDLPSEEEEESDFDEVETPDEQSVHADVKMADHHSEDEDVTMGEPEIVPPKDPLTRPPPTPPLPLSPVSNPSSPPPRKRQRTAGWHPPDYIPDFLPPFPTDEPRRSPSPPPTTDPTAIAANPVKMERPNTPPLQQAEVAAAATTSSANPSADYLTVIPYEESTLAKQPAWHLPQAPPPDHSSSNRSSMPLPQTQPALLGAYHHILTHPPSTRVTSVNPARYRAALAFLADSEANPRWDAPTTLFGATAPNPPRVAPMPPSYAVPIGKSPGTPEGKEKEEDKRPNFPPPPPRNIVPCERLVPTVSQPGSRLPKLARQVLSGPVYARTTRLGHPPVLQRGSQKLTYGPGVNAPWNASFSPMPATTPGLGKGKDGAGAGTNGVAGGGKEKEKEPPRPLPDARLYATWAYEPKAFDEVLVVRRRMGSVHRAKSESAN